MNFCPRDSASQQLAIYLAISNVKTLVAGIVIARILQTLVFLCCNASAVAQDATVDFAREIVPILTKAGCNSGACHGAAAGRGYLSLSLFGSRVGDDYSNLVHSNRFIDLQQPGSSLVLQKPGGFLDHGGDLRLDPDGVDFRVLERWIGQGCLPGSRARLMDIQILPEETIISRLGQTAQFQVRAIWSDGATIAHDPRHLLFDGASLAPEQTPVSYWLNEDSVYLQATTPGYWPITVRLGSVAKTIQLWVRATDRTLPNENSLATIDNCIANASARVGIELADASETHILARRLWIDLTGDHPNLQQWQDASHQIRAGKKSELVAQLLRSPEFTRRAGQEITAWASSAGNRDAVGPLADAIAEYLEHNDSLLDLSRLMIEVDAGSESDLSNFHRLASNPRERTELIASTFMGVRLGCAQCHDHPLDHWTQDDYFGLAACWAEIEAGPQIRRIPSRETTDLRTGRSAIPRLPSANTPYEGNLPPDLAFTNWLCNEKNDLFKRNIANRVWFWFFERGLVNEVDDHRATNPPINPELLDYLCRKLVLEDFSLRSLVNEIVLSDAYARESESSALELPRLLLAVRSPKSIPQVPARLAATALDVSLRENMNAQSGSQVMMIAAEPASCTRDEPCDDPTSKSLSLVAGQQLNEVIRKAIASAWEEENSSFSQRLNRLHQQLFGNSLDPSDAQMLLKMRAAANSIDERDIAEDILWSWIVSPRFLALH